MSNILNVFNPPPAGPVDDNFGRDCLPCTLIQAALAIGGGTYLYSGAPFREANGKIDLKKNPLWWQKSIRGASILVVGIGAYRLGEAVIIAWDRWSSRSKRID